MKNKTLFFVSLSIAIYLSLLYLNAQVFKITYPLVGVFQELLTLPILLLQVGLFVLAVIRLIRGSTAKDAYLVGSLLLLSICLLFVIRSFIVL